MIFKSLLQLWTRSHHCHCSSLFREVKCRCGYLRINFEPQLTENRTLRTSWCRAEPTMSVPRLQVLWILTKFACKQQKYRTITLSNEILISPKRFCATRTSAGWQLTAQFLERTTGTHPVSASLRTTLPSSKWTEPCLARGRRFGRPVFQLQSVFHKDSFKNYIFHQLVKYFEKFQGTEYAGWAKTGLAGWGHTIKFGLGGSNSGQS